MNIARILCGGLFLAACSSAPHVPAPATDRPAGSSSAADSSWMVLEDMQGVRHDLSAALSDNRRVALVFWQAWCGACVREAPSLVAASRRLAGQVDFYGVISGPDESVDELAVAAMTKKLELPYPQVRDRTAELARRFEVRGTPTIVVIEPSGAVSHNGHELPPAWTAR